MRTRCLAEECTPAPGPSTAGGSPCRRVTERGRQDNGVEISVPWPSCKIVTRCPCWFAVYLCKGPPFPWAQAGQQAVLTCTLIPMICSLSAGR